MKDIIILNYQVYLKKLGNVGKFWMIIYQMNDKTIKTLYNY